MDILADILLGSQAYWIAFVYTNLALALFLVRFLCQCDQQTQGASGHTNAAGPRIAGTVQMRTLRQNLSVMADGLAAGTGRRRRNYFLLAIAGSQVLSSYFLTHY